jgi:peptide/nickel transport system substrate-binding protein
LVDYKVGEFYRLEANLDYHMGRPLVNQLDLVVIKDLSTMFTALKSGEIDGAARTLPPELAADWKDDSDIEIIQTPLMWGINLVLNNMALPFGNLETRRALSYCIDRDELLQIVGLGQGTSGTAGYPHPESFHRCDGNTQLYDPETGKQLFSKLGYKDRDGDGFREDPNGKPIDWDIVAEASQPLYIRAAEIIVDQLKQVGLKTHVKTLERGAFTELIYRMGNYNMAVMELVPHGLADDDMMIVLQYGEKKTDMMPYSARDAALESWKAAATVEQRRAASCHLQGLINSYPRRLMLWYPTGFFAYNKRAYDNYSLIRGYNIFNKYSFIPNEARKGFVLRNQ